MGARLNRVVGAAVVLWAALGGAFGEATAQTVPNQGPGGPILIVDSPTAQFGRFYAEILRNEGFNEFAVADIGSVTAGTLAAYDVVILVPTSLTSTQASMFSTWVTGGGNLVAMRPDSDLANLLGVSISGTPQQNGYILIDTSPSLPGNGIVGETIQFFGAADGLTPTTATSLARLYSNATTPTVNAAVTMRQVGTAGGTAVAFAYDLATSLVYARQGNPAWVNQERDGLAPLRSDDLYFGAAEFDPRPDWVDFDKIDIPQADEQQRFLANLILHVNRDRKPLPRFWYFPRGEKAVIVMTGDDHANNGTQGRFEQFIELSPPNCSVEEWECIRGTSYMYPNTPMPDAVAAVYANLGFELGLHLTTNCANFTQSGLDSLYNTQIGQFTASFPSLPPLVSQRHHCIAWSDWAITARVQRAHGIRLDTTYYYWPPSWVLNRPGFMTGSAMPMRFVDLDGTLIDVYQAATQLNDEAGQQYPYTVDTMLDWALGPQGYYGTFTANMHTDVARIPQSDAILSSAIARGVPIISAAQLLKWLDARNASSFSGITAGAGTLSFSVSKHAQATGLQAMVPYRSPAGAVTSITRDGAPIAFEVVVVKGLEYAAVDAASGAYVVTYQPDVTPPSVQSTVPANGAIDVDRFIPLSVVFSEAVDPATISAATVTLKRADGTTIPSQVQYEPVSRSVIIQPPTLLDEATVHTITVKGGAGGVRDIAGNAMAADFVATFTTGSGPNCPCTGWGPEAVPENPADSDPSATEVGVKFTVDVEGFVSGIRFYKGPGNTGPHIGSLWTASGTLLASAQFTNETSSGWQQVNFDTPVAVARGQVYIASYHAPNGHYAQDVNYFAGAGLDAGLITFPGDAFAGGNGVYAYGPARTFPTESFGASNYWVDVVFSYELSPDNDPPQIAARSPAAGAVDVSPVTVVTVTFNEAINPATVSAASIELRGDGGALVPANVAYDSATRTATLTPTAPLAQSTVYSVTVKGGSGGVADLAGNALTADVTWSFTTTAPDTTPPVIVQMQPAAGSTGVATVPSVRATFNEPLQAASVGTATFELRDSSGMLVSATVTYDDQARTATLVPVGALWGLTTYTATVRGGAAGVKDAAGNALASDVSWTFTTGASTAYSAWSSSAVPGLAAEDDPSAVELGVKFTVDVGGFITGVRFYKGPGNNGPHLGNLWSADGQRLASKQFTDETATGWQQVIFDAPVPVSPGVVYIASYHTPSGHYAADGEFFAAAGVDAGPVNLLQDGVAGGNGVFAYSTQSAFPSDSYQATNYWVDVLFETSVVDVTPPVLTEVTPADGSANVNAAGAVKARFNEPVSAITVSSSTFELRDSSGALVPATVTYDASTSTAQLTPNAALAPAQTYTASVRGGTSGVRDLAGNPLPADVVWTFTTSASDQHSAWDPSDPAAVPEIVAENDSAAVELGVKFTVDTNGYVTGVRFYKGPGNDGPHVGNLWTLDGELLARKVFANETSTGWQQVLFDSPVPVTAGTVYVASYHAPSGHYSADSQFFAAAGVDAGPVNLLRDGVAGGNGVFAYDPQTSFPSFSYEATNYWVDVVFATSIVDVAPPTVTQVAPASGSTDASAAATITARFSEPVDPATLTAATFELRDSTGTPVPASVAYNQSTWSAELTPSAVLSLAATYTATVRGGAAGVHDVAGNALPSDVVWSFTINVVDEHSAWNPSDPSAAPSQPNENDSAAVELGVKFTVDKVGYITGVRFYKEAGNTGPHVGNLWTAGGQLLASKVFVNETPTGWQQVAFDNPVQVVPGTVYVASYHAPNGHYSADDGFFATQGVDAGVVNLLQDGVAGGNGVFAYSEQSSFPSLSYQSTNYWVDVVYSSTLEDAVPPSVTSVTPSDGSVDVSAATLVTAQFSEQVDPATLNASTFELRDTAGVPVPAGITYNSGTATAALDPVDLLSVAQTYVATVRGGASGVRDVAGNALPSDVTWTFTTETVLGACSAPPNAIVAENCLPGNPDWEWDVDGIGDPSIQGFATDISVDQGGTISFKIDTDAAAYTIDIYRLGYYNGMGARKVATVAPSATLPQIQPDCLSDPTTGLIDCGNWQVSASWQVPQDATSGIYIARPRRLDTGGASHIVFIVRDDDSTSDILLQTSDTTWQAYNTYGGNSLYVGQPVGRAYKVSYNRPFITRIVDNGQDWLFNAEYPMLRWLEANGYDVTYTTGVDSERRGQLILNHKVFMSVGHDEYWSGPQRANVEAARDGGVHLAFFSGNEVFWKTRWEPSVAAGAQPYRTLVSYKETHANGLIDPQSPPTWTGTWRDDRFSPPADGGRPENALTGTIFLVNGLTTEITVPAADGKMRFWRNTSIASLPANATATLGEGTLGYEWDEDADNGARPPGLIRLSTTVVENAPILLDEGSNYGTGTATHHLTLYRHASGALVFGAGTIQWSWGLDSHHDLGDAPPDPRMQQATVNLLADMHVQPATLQSGLVPATASTDFTAPVSTITQPANGAVVQRNSLVTIRGTASDVGGQVGGVEVSVDNGVTWHPADGGSTWTYSWRPSTSGSTEIRSRAVDDSGNLELPGPGITVTVN